ncbi:MAG: wax ester/triacylglycerol synthase family O-acyltransferase [Solirubrobacteraceae bacterium]
MSVERLSALDASFLAVESPTSPMHVGWVAVYDPPGDGPGPTFDELFEHLAGRLERAPRYRQRLAHVPFGLHEPVWVDDPGFDAAEHVLPADGEDLSAIVDAVLSTPLARDRPLWEMWIADTLSGGRIAIVGKAHHCMVDGTAVVELGKLLLDSGPDAPDAGRAGGWAPAPAPSSRERLARAVADRAADGATLALAPMRLATRLPQLPGLASRGARTLSHTLLPPAPGSPLNRPGSPRRHHVRVMRSLADLRALRRRFGVSPNDVVIATCAGALRRFAERRGEPPQRLKVMVPADVRRTDDATSGNRISFTFIDLPCDEADPVERLRVVHRATAQRARDGEAEDVDAAFRALALTPPPLQRALAHAFAHPRLFNLTISSVAGPAPARYLRGCRLSEVHSAVPLAGRHALSIGVVTVAGQVCFGVLADATTLPDADALGDDLDAAFDELLAAA